MRVACVIYFWGKFNGLGNCALSSFKKHHPEVDLYHISDENTHNFDAFKFREGVYPGLFKYLIAAELMAKRKYDKVIVLGGDTITCSRLDEFLDDNERDVIVTLDYPHQINLPFKYADSGEVELYYTPIVFYECDVDRRGTLEDLKKTNILFSHIADLRGYTEKVLPPGREARPLEYLYFNADVVCFNNLNAIKKIIEITLVYKDIHDGKIPLPSNTIANFHSFYGEQGGLNLFCIFSLHPDEFKEYNFKIGFADAPYFMRDCVYNVRSKGNRNLHDPRDTRSLDDLERELKPWGPHIKKWRVEADKLFDPIGRQIKVFHYCDGLAGLNDDTFNKIMNKYIFDWFTEETKTFFKESCDCGDFFEKEFMVAT